MKFLLSDLSDRSDQRVGGSSVPNEAEVRRDIEHYQSMMDAVIARKQQPFQGPLACGHERPGHGATGWLRAGDELNEICVDCLVDSALAIDPDASFHVFEEI